MGKYPDRDYSLKGLGVRVDKLEDERAALDELADASVMIRKGYNVAKRWGPWVLTALATTNVFGPKISAFLTQLVQTFPG